LLAEALIASGNTEASLSLLEKSLELSATVNTKKLEIEYLILYGASIGGNCGIETINSGLKLNAEYKSLRLEKSLAGINYIKALDALYKNPGSGSFHSRLTS